MTQQMPTEDVRTNLSEKVRFPTQAYDRKHFYKTFTNIQYTLGIQLMNGKQAEDVPVGIRELTEFLGDTESVVQNTDGVSVQYKNHTHWTCKLEIENDLMMTDIDWRGLENTIENLAKEYGIALKKSVSMSGRGYNSKDMRLVNVNYSFGNHSEQNRLIQDENNPLSKVNWVGGEIGNKEDIKTNTVRTKSTRRAGQSLTSRILNFLHSRY